MTDVGSNKKRSNTAVANFRETLKIILSGDPDGLFNLANDLQYVSKTSLIKASYELAIEHGVVEAYLNYGNYLDDVGQRKAARKMWAKAFEAGDDRAAVLIAQHLVEDGDLVSAEEWYSRTPNVPEAALLHARLKERLGKSDEALEILKKNSGADAEAAVELVLQHGNIFSDGGIDLLEKHHKSGNFDVNIPLANLYDQRGNCERAITLLRESVHIGEPHAAFNLGTLLLKTNKPRKGMKWINRAAKSGDSQAKKFLINSQKR